ncbi:MAG TPA: vitamin B12-dependent ribonucleotide reductase, partial [Solirubrobacteraceae bacterium]|nr:vitamin B12-dependent ribonucleotide reductase [Solirubrobacteraceae bacterium]
VQEELGILTKDVRARKAAQDAATSQYGDTAGPASRVAANGGGSPAPAAAAFTEEPPVTPALNLGLDLGPACQQCGGMMQRTGSCYTCGRCGFNTGCG